MNLPFKSMNEIEIFEGNSLGADISSDFIKTDQGYIVKRTVRNATAKQITLGELCTTLQGISFGGEASEDYFYCNENNRIYGTMTLPVDFDRKNPSSPENERFGVDTDTRWADPDTVGGRVCASPYQPFPAVLLSNYQSTVGLLIGSLSQETFYHNYEVGHDRNGLFVRIYFSFKGIAKRTLQPNEELTDCFCILETERADDINLLFAEYTRLLRTVLQDNCGAGTANRHTLLWDSWNDGIYRGVSEEMLIQEAKAVKSLFPSVEWFQLDDGYSAFCDENPDLSAHGLGVAYEGAEGVDSRKFPHGLKGYTDKIKEIGLKPSIWVGGLCPVQSKIYREHPEWFIDYTYRIDFSQPLDVSKREAREYMSYAVDELVTKSGFEGVKIDFWSYAFEDSKDLLCNKDKSGYEYRTWWQQTLRSAIPPHGYLQTGCDVCAGNPFLGKYFNNYRFGLDVGAGKWNNIKTTVFWGMAALTTHTGDLFIPNSDSIGLLPALDDTDFAFVVNYQIVTRTLVEISGRFSRPDIDKKRLEMIKRATMYLNNGENVFFPKFDYRRAGMNLPEIAYIDSAFDNPNEKKVKTVALFNADEEEKEIFFTTEDIGVAGEAVFTDVWSGEEATTEKFVCKLPAHGSKLMYVKYQEER